jgi:putative endonuclease
MDKLSGASMGRDSPIDYRQVEDFVAERLVQARWRILARNYRSIGFELDIVAEKEKTLAIVEVKGRRTDRSNSIDLETLIPRRKRASLLRGAQHFISAHTDNWDTIRFDLAVVEKKGPVLNPPVLRYFVGFLSPFD